MNMWTKSHVNTRANLHRGKPARTNTKTTNTHAHAQVGAHKDTHTKTVDTTQTQIRTDKRKHARTHARTQVLRGIRTALKDLPLPFFDEYNMHRRNEGGPPHPDTDTNPHTDDADNARRKRGNGARFAEDDHAIKSPLMRLRYYDDGCKVVKSADREGRRDRPEPEAGLVLDVVHGSLCYGPWENRQRELLQAFFFPPDFEPRKVYVAREGQLECKVGFRVTINFKESVRMLLPYAKAAGRKHDSSMSYVAGDNADGWLSILAGKQPAGGHQPAARYEGATPGKSSREHVGRNDYGQAQAEDADGEDTGRGSGDRQHDSLGNHRAAARRRNSAGNAADVARKTSWRRYGDGDGDGDVAGDGAELRRGGSKDAALSEAALTYGRHPTGRHEADALGDRAAKRAKPRGQHDGGSSSASRHGRDARNGNRNRDHEDSDSGDDSLSTASDAWDTDGQSSVGSSNDDSCNSDMYSDQSSCGSFDVEAAEDIAKLARNGFENLTSVGEVKSFTPWVTFDGVFKMETEADLYDCCLASSVQADGKSDGAFWECALIKVEIACVCVCVCVCVCAGHVVLSLFRSKDNRITRSRPCCRLCMRAYISCVARLLNTCVCLCVCVCVCACQYACSHTHA
jgi:hypothetical protein